MVGLAARGYLKPWIHIWQIYQRVLVDLVLFLGSRPKQEVNQVMGRETQPGIVVPERLSTRTASQYTDSQSINGLLSIAA